MEWGPGSKRTSKKMNASISVRYFLGAERLNPKYNFSSGRNRLSQLKSLESGKLGICQDCTDRCKYVWGIEMKVSVYIVLQLLYWT